MKPEIMFPTCSRLWGRAQNAADLKKGSRKAILEYMFLIKSQERSVVEGSIHDLHEIVDILLSTACAALE